MEFELARFLDTMRYLTPVFMYRYLDQAREEDKLLSHVQRVYWPSETHNTCAED